MKDTVTETELYALKGLRYMAAKRREQLEELESFVAEILGEDEEQYNDWSFEIIWNMDDKSVEEILSQLQIGVKYDG